MNIKGWFATQRVKGITITDNFCKKRNNSCLKNMAITEFPVCYNSQAREWPQEVTKTGVFTEFLSLTVSILILGQ
jgi:hypothetical protein